MTSEAEQLPRRYPGLKPFERAQSMVFHGRAEDVQHMANLVLRERLVVLFAKSGIGKTSLLQAGLAPELERQEFAPVFLRTDKTDAPLLDTLSAVLAKHPMVSGYDKTGESPGERHSLWEQMKRLEFDLNGLPATPVLVFDQFEEVFTLSHSEKSRNEFLAELAELTNESIPEGIRSRLLQRFAEQNSGIDVGAMQWWERQPELRIILSIRSDFLHLMEQISPLIPGILRNRYQLKPLSREKARSAIVQPARSGGLFASPPFQYSETALNEIIDFLAGHASSENDEEQAAEDAQTGKKRDEIESVNLQIVCQDFEEKIIDWQKSENFVVESDFYEGVEGLQRSIKNFYLNQLKGFPKAYVDRIQQKSVKNTLISEDDKRLSAAPEIALRQLAQRLIEESLVTSGNRRNSVVDDTLLDEYKVSPDFLDTLVDKSRLLRKEPRLDDFYYEISHDTLLPAVIESRNNRRAHEKADAERAALEAQLAREAELRKESDAARRILEKQRTLARIIALFMFTTVLVMVYNWWFGVKKELEQAEFIVSREAFAAGLESYDNLLSRPLKKFTLGQLTGKDIEAERRKVAEMQQLYDSIVYANLVTGDSLFFSDNYAPALTRYRQAYDMVNTQYNPNNDIIRVKDNIKVWRIEPGRIQEKFETLYQRREFALKALIAQFKIRQRDAETFMEARVWKQALRNFDAMQALLPQHPDDERRLRDALNLGSQSPSEYVAQERRHCLAGLQQ